MSTVPGVDTTSPSPVQPRPTTPPWFPARAVTPDPDAAPLVHPSIAPGEADLPAQVTDRLMADLVQSLAVNQARGNPHNRSFYAVMTGLRQACGSMTEGFEQVCLDVEVIVQKTTEEATAHDRAFTAKAAKDLDLWILALQPLFDNDRILGRSREAAQNQLQDGGPVQVALLQSLAQVEAQCVATWEKVTNQVPEILAQHVPKGLVGVFLATLYQLICTQQQGIISMVVAQARVPVHLGVHSWAM